MSKHRTQSQPNGLYVYIITKIILHVVLYFIFDFLIKETERR